jgi:hypothetical protein
MPAKARRTQPGSDVRGGFREVEGALAFFPLTALFEQLDAFKTLEDAALGTNGAAAGLEGRMLGHGNLEKLGVKNAVKRKRNLPSVPGNAMEIFGAESGLLPGPDEGGQ